MSSEQELLNILAKKFKHAGDDTAILPLSKHQYQLFSTDISIEHVHFSKKYATLSQIGYKAMIANISDIASMGGTPTHAVVSLGIPHQKNKETVKALYKGITKAAKQYKCEIVGGDLTKSRLIIINISILGNVQKKRCVKRTGAKQGHFIAVTNTVGDSSTGLALLKQKKKGISINKHLMPQAQIKLGKQLSKVASAMIDTSDGLATAIHQLCTASNVGATINANNIPISTSTLTDCKKLKQDSLKHALYGGEDYQLVFTIPKAKKLPKNTTIIGTITSKKQVLVTNDKKTSPLQYGYDHFNSK